MYKVYLKRFWWRLKLILDINLWLRKAFWFWQREYGEFDTDVIDGRFSATIALIHRISCQHWQTCLRCDPTKWKPQKRNDKEKKTLYLCRNFRFVFLSIEIGIEIENVHGVENRPGVVTQQSREGKPTDGLQHI